MLYNVKAGMIGLDELGIQYAELLKTHVKNLNLIAACGRNQKQLLYAKNSLSLEYVYGDEKQLIENHDIDAVFIFAEAHLRANLAIQAIEAGKHVYMLNPIALNVEDAQATYKSAESHPSQTVMCSSSVKGSQVLKLLKKIIIDGELGEIQLIQLDSGFIHSINKSHSKATGSKYLDDLLDEIELCQWLSAGKIKNVEIIKREGLKICLAYSGDKLISQYMIQDKGDNSFACLRIYGSNANLVLDNKNKSHIDVSYLNGEQIRYEIDPTTQFLFSEYLQLNHFTNCILGKEKNKYKLDSAVESMRLALAFEKSDVLNSPVDV